MYLSIYVFSNKRATFYVENSTKNEMHFILLKMCVKFIIYYIITIKLLKKKKKKINSRRQH